MTGRYPNQEDGLARSVNLMRALGKNASAVWSALDPADAAKITRMMDQRPPDLVGSRAAAASLLEEAQENRPGQDIWQKLSDISADQLSDLLDNEHPQVIALVLSRIAPKAAAAIVRRAPTVFATDVLHRMLTIGSTHERAISALEKSFEARLSGGRNNQINQPDETVARILDALPDTVGNPLLKGLHTIEPGAYKRVRRLMFTFADLANLTPAGMQTLLSRAKRQQLTLALKGLNPKIAAAFFNNMTMRARDLLQEEIRALGPCPRSDVEAARNALVALARNLVETGDIRLARGDADTELVY